MREPGTQNVVLAHGCFDVLHLGHKRHLEEARSLGDRLIVSITPDHLINKGPGRPIFTAEQRREMLLALECVDDVVISESGDAAPIIEQLKPAVYVKGIDYEGSDNPSLANEKAAVEAHGGRFHLTRTAKWSSSRIINTERLSDVALRYLDRIRGRGNFDRIGVGFDRADKLNILFVGETIIDEYRYVQALAKPSKEFILATVEAREPEQFLGGVVAASQHADWKNVKVVTDDGEPLKKTRFVDADFSRKLFEVYSKPRLDLSATARDLFQGRMVEAIAEADCVVVMDFGHGLLDKAERSWIEDHAKFLAINAQTNAGNHGFNAVTKYKSADLICVDVPEAQLATGRQNETDAQALGLRLASRMDACAVIVTQGRNGATAVDSSVHAVPAFGSRALDTMGAGDAFLAVTAPLVAAGLDLEAATFVGNVAGALKTEIVGHRRHVERAELMQSIEALLK